MHVLPEAFNLATGIGLWQPTHWQSNIAKGFYKLYTVFVFITIILFQITQISAVVFLTKSMDIFTEVTCMLLSSINATVKGGTMFMRRQQVIALLNILLQKPCIAENNKEKKLIVHFNQISRYTVISCIILAEATGVVLVLSPILFQSGELTLPMIAWHPYKLNSRIQFWFSYTHQGLSFFMVAAIDVAVDTIITGFMVHICAQLELVSVRLQEISRTSSQTIKEKTTKDIMQVVENNIVSRTVQHHLLIFRLTDNINAVFAPVIFIQFCLSSLVLCVTVYQLTSNQSHGFQLIYLTMYLICMLIEFFIYCWFGNEVILKSTEFISIVSKMDWTTMHVKTLRELLIIMIRSSSPILISCGPLITLSLNSFMSILKVSYSAFNILQKTV